MFEFEEKKYGQKLNEGFRFLCPELAESEDRAKLSLYENLAENGKLPCFDSGFPEIQDNFGEIKLYTKTMGR